MKRVLIVDDNPTNLRLAASVLELEGYTVDKATDGSEALDRLAEATPDIVLMDIALPGTDGLTLTRQIKADPRWRRIPIVALTAFAMKGDDEKAREAGCCGYLTKPIDTRQFAAQVARHIDPPALGKVLIADDHPANLRLLRAQLEAEGIEILEATNGEEALDVLRREAVDGVVSDILMPRMDGYRLCMEIRRDRELARLPFVLYTSTYSSDADRDLALSTGADAYLSKPSPVTEILAALHAASERANGPPQPQGSLESPVLRQYSESLIRKLEERNVELSRAYIGLAEAEARLSGLVESALDAIIVLDREHRILLFNAAAEKMFGYQRDELLGSTLDPLIPAESRGQHARWINQFGEEERERRPMSERIVWAQRKCGARFPTEASISRLMTSRGWLFTVFLRDVTERHKTQKALARSEAHLRRVNRVLSVLSRINNLIVRVDNRQELLEDSCRVAVEAGRFPKAWIALVAPDDGALKLAAANSEDPSYLEQLSARLAQQDAPQLADWLATLRRGEPVVVDDVATEHRLLPFAIESQSRSVAALPLQVGDRLAGVMVLYADEAGFFDEEEMRLLGDLGRDISHALNHLDQAERIRYLARFDPLTGLPNRHLFTEQLARRLSQHAENGGALWVVVLDIERFRRINETLGRSAGDQLLQRLAQRLQQLSPDAARLAGDQFAFTLDTTEGEPAALHTLEQVLNHCTGAPYPVDERELRLGCRAGVATFPMDGNEAEALILNAEAALRQARAQTERRAFYAPSLNARAAEALALESRLRTAITRSEFVLHYQPKICLASGKICGAEALIRWQDPQRGLVSPGEFIPVLEETGMIGDVGAWALARALSDQEAWRRAGLAPPPVAVNVSSLQLRRQGFADAVTAELSRWDQAQLELEITESVLMDEVERNIESLTQLRAAGIGIAVDDFGTGYSSLSYVARLPITALKIDRSFVLAMQDDAGGMAVASSIVALAHSLDLVVVAEGVETEAQAAALRELGCDEAQGFLYSRPVPADDFAGLLSRGLRQSLQDA